MEESIGTARRRMALASWEWLDLKHHEYRNDVWVSIGKDSQRTNRGIIS
jgi:hypothetical protein